MKIKSFLLGLIIGSLIAPVIQYFLFRPLTPMEKCIKMYSNNPEITETNPTVREILKREGKKNVKELIEDRCKGWVANGQFQEN